MADVLRLALTTFTVTPLRAGRIDRRIAGGAICAGPLVGALLALVAAAVLVTGRQAYGDGVLGVLIGATLAIAVLALLTRGMHLDGFADTIDGLGCYGSPERALVVMRSPGIGPFAMAAVLLAIVLQITTLAACVREGRGTISLFVAVVAGRLAIVWACRDGVPAARPDGLGALVAGTVPGMAALGLTMAAGLALSAGAALDDQRGANGSLRAGFALLIALIVADLLRRHAVRRLGGITGDVLGALVEVSATVALLLMAIGSR